jgi:hypothetical protein
MFVAGRAFGMPGGDGLVREGVRDRRFSKITLLESRLSRAEMWLFQDTYKSEQVVTG